MIVKTRQISFPRMKMEAGEKRVFLPEFIKQLSDLGFEIFIEEGYGSRSGFQFEDYQQTFPGIQPCTREEAFQKEHILILRCPHSEEFDLIRPGSCLISMVHYPTRPQRIERLQQRNINAISLDGIVDDHNVRLVQNMKAVAWNGLEAAFDTLEEHFSGLIREDGRPWQVLVLGSGMVGRFAVDAGVKLGNVGRYQEHNEMGGQGAIVRCVGRNISQNPVMMKQLFQESDILVDATQRRNPSKPVVPNEWIAWLPEHAIVVDLAVDPYLLEDIPSVVRGVEGIPRGNLDKYVFEPGDADWDNTVPPSVPSQQRRTTVSCYSWPGIHPEACMRHYAQQILPMMEVLVKKNYHSLSPEGGYFERALHRATLSEWVRVQNEENLMKNQLSLMN